MKFPISFLSIFLFSSVISSANGTKKAKRALRDYTRKLKNGKSSKTCKFTKSCKNCEGPEYLACFIHNGGCMSGDLMIQQPGNVLTALKDLRPGDEVLGLLVLAQFGGDVVERPRKPRNSI